MKIYENVYATSRPLDIEVTENRVFLASEIEEVDKEIEEGTAHLFKFKITEYEKDEYIQLLAQNNTDIAALQEELIAAKIILGVE